MSRSMWGYLLLLAGLGAAAGALLLWLEPTPSTLARAERRGVIRIGYALEEPYAFRDSGGRVTGESPEIARHVFRRLGIDSIEWVRTQFDALIPELRAGHFDVVAAGMYDTPARRRLVAFTRPTHCAGHAFLVRRGNPKDLHGYSDVRRRADARLAVLRGAVEAEFAVEVGVPRSRVLSVPDVRTGYAALLADRVDALALTAPTVRRIAAEDTILQVLEPARPFHPFTGGAPPRVLCGALAVRRGDTGLLRAVDGVLDGFIGSAGHRRLAKRLGFTENDLPHRGLAAAPAR